jgi:hypothetical protein
MNDVKTDGNADRIYRAENVANRVAKQARNDKKTRLKVTEQNASEFDRIADVCGVRGGVVEGEIW